MAPCEDVIAPKPMDENDIRSALRVVATIGNRMEF
jgi:hypothetical protein